MDALFNQFQELVSTRLNHHHGSFKAFGEDSIRYDFYAALQQVYGLKPHQIILEQAIPASQFVQTERDPTKQKQGRHTDKPEFDLRVDPTESLEQGILAEFAFFRNPAIGKLDTSGAYGKILNEIHRLALLKHYRNDTNDVIYQNFSNYKCLLICVTDHTMLNYGNGSRGRKPGSIVNSTYLLNQDFLSPLPKTIKNCIQPRFLQQVDNFQIIPTATRTKEILSEDSPDRKPWGIWAWEVKYQRK